MAREASVLILDLANANSGAQERSHTAAMSTVLCSVAVMGKGCSAAISARREMKVESKTPTGCFCSRAY